jgi:hypothetical protein
VCVRERERERERDKNYKITDMWDSQHVNGYS